VLQGIDQALIGRLCIADIYFYILLMHGIHPSCFSPYENVKPCPNLSHPRTYPAHARMTVTKLLYLGLLVIYTCLARTGRSIHCAIHSCPVRSSRRCLVYQVNSLWYFDPCTCTVRYEVLSDDYAARISRPSFVSSRRYAMRQKDSPRSSHLKVVTSGSLAIQSEASI